MSEDETRQNSSSSGGWSTYKRLILRMLEDSVSDIRTLLADVTELKTKVDNLTTWVTDIHTDMKGGQRSDAGKLEVLGNRLTELESDLRAISRELSEASHNTAALKAKTEEVSRPSLLLAIWNTTVGKVLFFILAISLLFAGVASYNAVSVYQYDINKLKLEERVPTGSGNNDAAP